MGITYDKAKYHLEGNFPSTLPAHQSYVHTGFFIGWLADHDLLSDEIRAEFSNEISRFKRRELTGPNLYRILGGVFDSTLLTERGDEFTRSYFDFDSGDFLKDYGTLLAKGLSSVYAVEDTWVNYIALARRIDSRFSAFIDSLH